MDWLGYLVIGFVCFWMLVTALVVLRTGLFMLLLMWAGLRQWREYRVLGKLSASLPGAPPATPPGETPDAPPPEREVTPTA